MPRTEENPDRLREEFLDTISTRNPFSIAPVYFTGGCAAVVMAVGIMNNEILGMNHSYSNYLATSTIFATAGLLMQGTRVYFAHRLRRFSRNN